MGEHPDTKVSEESEDTEKSRTGSGLRGLLETRPAPAGYMTAVLRPLRLLRSLRVTVFSPVWRRHPERSEVLAGGADPLLEARQQGLHRALRAERADRAAARFQRKRVDEFAIPGLGLIALGLFGYVLWRAVSAVLMRASTLGPSMAAQATETGS